MTDTGPVLLLSAGCENHQPLGAHKTKAVKKVAAAHPIILPPAAPVVVVLVHTGTGDHERTSGVIFLDSA